MKPLTYINELITFLFKGFGFTNSTDFITSTFKVVLNPAVRKTALTLSTALATLFMWIEQITGLDIWVVFVFVVLIIAEFQTGVKADLKMRKERFKSRKFGRMLLKICVYVMLLAILHTLAERFVIPEVLGFDVNPFIWLYYMFFVLIIFQLLISYLENLSVLGYKEAGGFRGLVLNKFNKWFEFDGSKHGEKFDKEL